MSTCRSRSIRGAAWRCSFDRPTRPIASPPACRRRCNASIRTCRDSSPERSRSTSAVSLLPVRLAAGVTTVVAALALGLAIVGLYSLVSFLVAERTHEIGLRMALGAAARDVLRLVVGYGAQACRRWVWLIGIPAALAASRLLGTSALRREPDRSAGVLVGSSRGPVRVCAGVLRARAARDARGSPDGAQATLTSAAIVVPWGPASAGPTSAALLCRFALKADPTFRKKPRRYTLP